MKDGEIDIILWHYVEGCHTLLFIFSDRNGLSRDSRMLMYHGWFTMYTPLNLAGNAFCAQQEQYNYIW